MTYKERFFGDGHFAAATLGTPALVHPVDYSVFKKTKEQKEETILFKFRHQKMMRERGLNPKKELNVPELRLEQSILITT